MTYKIKPLNKRRAFTLIELLIVIAIIGILFIVLISKVDFTTDKAKATGVQTDFRSFQVAIESVAKENSGLATLGWDTGDANGNRIRDSYDKGDTNKNGKQDDGEVFIGSKTYGETWTNVYTLTNPADENDKSAIVALEEAINKNLDPKLHITIHDDLTITMANGAQDPWNTEYHGYYITNATTDGKDRGAIIMYSNGANQEWGSEHSISNGVVVVNVPGNNVYGKDDYSVAVAYTYVNGYGEVKTTTSGFSVNQGGTGGSFITGGSSGEEPEEDNIIDNVVNAMPEPDANKTLNDYTWKEIQALAYACLTPEEYKTKYGIELGQKKDDTYWLVDFDGNEYEGFIFMYKTNNYSNWNGSSTNVGGYAASNLAVLTEACYVELPLDLQEVIKEVTIKCNNGSTDPSLITEYVCHLFTPSHREIGGTSTIESEALDAEGQCFDYITSDEVRKTIGNVTSYGWFTRSAKGDSSSSFYYVYTDGSADNSKGASSTACRVPAFVVGVNEPQTRNKNSNKVLDSYSWSEINAIALEGLTPEEYKSKYGIEVGQKKDGKYILVDLDGNKYGGFVFMFNSDTKTIWSSEKAPGNKGYNSSSIMLEVENMYTTLPLELQNVIKQVKIRSNTSGSSLYDTYLHLFLPSHREVGGMSSVGNVYLNYEGTIFEYFENNNNELLSNTTWWTRSSANSNSYYVWTVSETGYSGHRSYADGTAQIVPAFVVGMASDSNPQITIDSYSWSEINAIALERLTPEEYKSKYGIELGQRKDDKYVLVDLDGNEYGGFIFMFDSGTTSTIDSSSVSNYNGYVQETIAEKTEAIFDTLPLDLQEVIKEVAVKCNNKFSAEPFYHTGHLFLASHREVGGTSTNYSSHLDAEGTQFDYFTSDENRMEICGPAATWWTRSVYGNSSGHWYVTNLGVTTEHKDSNYVLRIVPTFVVGVQNNSSQSIMPNENPSGTLNSYTWSEIKALAQAKLSSTEYKTKYGIELGQKKDDKYVLVDFDNYDGFVFMFASNKQEKFNVERNWNKGGYAKSYISERVEALYFTLSEDLQAVIKETTIKCNDGSYFPTTIYDYTCHLFLASHREVGGTETIEGDSLDAEGTIFDYFVDNFAPQNVFGTSTTWLRSAYGSSSNYVWTLNPYSAAMSRYSPSAATYMTPVFVVG